MKLLSALFEVTAYSAVLFAAVMGFKLAFKSRLSPALHFALWFLVIARLCIPVTVESDFHFFAASKPGGEAELQAPVPEAPEERTTAFTGGEAFSNAPSVEAPAPAPAAAAIPAAAPKRKPVSSWADALTALWIAGMAFRAARLLFSERSMRRAVAHNTLPTDARMRDIYDACCAELGIAHKLPLQSMAGIYSPALTVSLKPMILLPTNITDTLSEAQLAYALRHEFMHYRRRDHLLALLLLLLTCVYWFNPVVWLMKRELMKDMETACDSAVTARLNGAERREYAMTLLALFSQPYRVNSVLGMALSSAEKDAERRVRGLFLARRSKAAIKALAASLASLLLLCCFTTACQPTPESPVIHSKGDIMDSIINGSELTATVPNIASKYEYKLLGNVKDSLRINDCTVDISAEIIAPNITACAAVKLKSYYYTEKDLEKFIGLFFEPSTALNYTNDTAESVEREILYYKKLIADLNSGNLPGDDLRSIDEQISDCEIQIVELEKKLLNLDEDSNNELSISFEKFTSAETLAQFIGKCNAKDYILEVCNMQDYGSSLIFYYKGLVKTVPVDNIAESDEPDLAASLSVADSYMEPLGIQDYVLYSKSVMDLKTIDSTNATTYVYNLQFVRSYNGSIAPSLIAPAPAGISTTNANKEQYGRCANPEVLKVITDGKEVFWFEWTNPYVIEGTVNSNVSVINQDEAMKIALSHLKNLLVEKEATKLFINRIELNGSYITIKDERDTFLLIPVWDIIGYQTLHDGSRYLGSPEYALSYVTINAVDGSIIDRNLGY